MSISKSVGVAAVSMMLLPALLNKPANSQYYNNPNSGQISPSTAPLELNPFLHGATTAPRAIPENQVKPVSQYAPEEQPRLAVEPQVQTGLEKPDASRLSVAKPVARKQKAVKRAPPIVVKYELPTVAQREPLAAKVASRRRAPTNDIKIAQPLAQPPSAPARADLVRATGTTASVPVPIEGAASTRQLAETPSPLAHGVRIVAADEFTELDRAAREVKIVSADELNDLDLAAGPSLQTNGSNPAEARLLPMRSAPSSSSALRAVMFGLGVPMVVGFLAWPLLARHRPGRPHLNYRTALHLLARLQARLGQCGATAATVWTSIKNAACTRRSIISNVLGG
jgi:hypothetical protein